MRCVLASRSPRRREILTSLGLDVRVRPVDVDETVEAGESSTDHALRLAVSKVSALPSLAPFSFGLGADTIVVMDGEILGKPVDPAEARRMLKFLAGRAHRVITGLAVKTPKGCFSGVSSTLVEMAPLTDPEIDWYVSTGEPLDKAGAYGIQGLASLFIESIEGSYSNVVGLPVRLLYSLMGEADLSETWIQSHA